MATTTFGVNDANAVKLWAKRLGFQIVYRTDISSLIGEDANSIIHLKSETQKSAGDKVTFSLMTELTGDGFTESEIAEGNGESLSTYADSVLINELGHVVGIPNKGRAIDEQRVPFNLRDAARMGLRAWWGKRMSTVFFNHVCGYTPETRAKYTGNNAIIAPSSGRHLWVDTAGNNSDGDENLASDDIFALKYVDYARETAETASNPVRPLNVEGYDDGRDISGGKYVMYLHPYQVTDLRTSTSTGQWLDIQKAALANGSASKNPIYTDALGEYNNVILKKANHVTLGADSSTATTSVANVRRAVLLGAQAASVAYGKDGGETDYGWNEELLDHKRKLEVSVMSIYGMKKNQFNSVDFGTVVVSSYAAAHS
jgi:N4-gp56 family major capsid protein